MVGHEGFGRWEIKFLWDGLWNWKKNGPSCCELYGGIFGGKVHGGVVRNSMPLVWGRCILGIRRIKKTSRKHDDSDANMLLKSLFVDITT